MGYESPKPQQGKQLDIEFEKMAEIALEKEKEKIMNKHGILDKDSIFKDPKDNTWRFYGTYRSVEEWAAERDALDSKEKHDPYHRN